MKPRHLRAKAIKPLLKPFFPNMIKLQVIGIAETRMFCELCGFNKHPVQRMGVKLTQLLRLEVTEEGQQSFYVGPLYVCLDLEACTYRAAVLEKRP